MKRRAYLGLASPPALLSALLLFVLLAVFGGVVLYYAFRLTLTETLITAAAGCMGAFLVHSLQLFGTPRIACVLGIDGIEVTHGFDARIVGRFVPWSDVLSIAQKGSAVHFALRGERELVVLPWTHPLYLDARALHGAFKERGPVEEPEGYRELDARQPILVRVASDPRQDLERRKAAFEKLDPHQRSEILEALADPETREQLAGIE